MKSSYTETTISLHGSKTKFVDTFAELKQTIPQISLENNIPYLYMYLSESEELYLRENNLSLFVYLVSSKFHPSFRIKSGLINTRRDSELINKTIPIGKYQSTCRKTTNIKYSYLETVKLIFPNQNTNITELLQTALNYLQTRYNENTLTKGKFNHYCFKNHPENSYFKYYLIVAPSLNFNFNQMAHKYKRTTIHSKLSIPIVFYTSAFNKEEVNLALEEIDDYKGKTTEKLYCLTVR